jgi:3-oxosteroid 1-dehydrogenase
MVAKVIAMTGDRPDEWDLDVDLVVGGTGIGGATAAIRADAAGLDVIVLEKAPSIGGVSAISGGEVWVGNNHLAAEAGIDDSLEEAEAYIRFNAPDEPDEALLAQWLRTAPRAIKFLEREAEVDWKLIEDYPDYLYPDAPGTKAEGRYLEVPPIRTAELGEWADSLLVSPVFPVGVTHDELFDWGGFAGFDDWDRDLFAQRREEGYVTWGTGVMAYLMRAVIDRDIPIHVETPICDLYADEVEVVGVHATAPDETPIRVRASDGVILAIGGYDWNEDLVDRYEFVPREEWASGSPPYVEGDHMDFARRLGADVFAFTQQARLPGFLPGFQIPGEEFEGEPLHRLVQAEIGTPCCIVVNDSGERFFNEAYYHDFVANVGRYDVDTSEYENWPCYAVLDRTHRERYPLGPIEPGAALPRGLGERADSLRDLATKLGVDPDGLESTVESFNEHARRGDDPAFDRGSTPWQQKFAGDPDHDPHPNLGPLTESPFYGVRLEAVGFDAPRAGLRIDEHARVLDASGDPIPNLYAAGNTAAYLDTGGAYNSGFAMSRGMTHGFLAAEHASDRPGGRRSG